jgi:UDP-N-acetyl-D-mannosaminuronic acid transferase (WecB/TagA/CpsF family)
VIWAALAFCILAVAGSLSYAAVRAWRLWKTLRATSRNATEAAGRVLASAEAAESKVASLGAGAERLAAAMEQLQASLAGLAVIRTAAAETQSLLASIRGLVPRK